MRIRGMTRIVLVPALALGLAACGGGKGDDGVASATGGKAKANASAAPSLDPKDAQLKFAQCMRQNGVDMPDPDGSGRVAIRGRPGSKGKTDAAMKNCEKFLQAGKEGLRPDDPQMRDRMLKFAQCMRQHGIDMPDPKPGGGIRLKVPKGSKAKVDAAHKACEKNLPGGGPGAPGKPAPAPAPGGGPK